MIQIKESFLNNAPTQLLWNTKAVIHQHITLARVGECSQCRISFTTTLERHNHLQSKFLAPF